MMKHLHVFFWVALASAALFAAAPAATVTSCEQDPATGLVTVRYTLDAPAVVTVDFQTNVTDDAWVSIGDSNFNVLAGDVNRYVAGDAGVIRWPAVNTWPDHALDNTKFRAVVKAWPTNDPPAYMTVDLGAAITNYAGYTRIHYYTSAAAVPFGVLHRRYRESVLLLRKIPCANRVFRMGTTFQEPAANATRSAPHRVKLTKNFYMSVFPITAGYMRTLRNFTLVVNSKCSDYALQPAITASSMKWSELRGTSNTEVGGYMKNFRDLVGEKVAFDLPTDAQYEFAAHGGFETALGTGRRYNKTLANTEVVYETCSIAGNKNDGTHPDFPIGSDTRWPRSAGTRAPNGYGLYDMQGNGRSRCRDVWVDNLSTVTSDLDADGVHVDPMGPAPDASANHVGRGCSWDASIGSFDWAAWGRFPQSDAGDGNYTTARIVCPAIAPAL